MTRDETRIIAPLLKQVRMAAPSWWDDLKYQTQYGPEFVEFPYFPAALQLRALAIDAVGRLNPSKKILLVAQWRSRPRLLKLDSEEEIINQYGCVLLDYIVETARWAALRSNFT